MNDEIKNILEFLKEPFSKEKTHKAFDKEDIKILLDYITNLQEERDMYKVSFETMSKNYFEEKSKNDKAIEYVDINYISPRKMYESGYGKGTPITICKEHLLNILQGKSDDNE